MNRMTINRIKVQQVLRNCLLPLHVKPVAKFFITFLLMVALQASATGFGQKVTLKLKDANLEQVFEEVRKQTGLQFVFNSDIIQKTKSISVNIVNVEVGEALELCFKNQSITFEIISQTIVLKPKKEVIVAENKAVLPPLSPVNGKVTDENGNPLAGATIIVKGSKNGAKTNEKGDFIINTEANDVLIVSYIGYEDLVIKVNKQTDLSLSLTPTKQNLSSVVVTALGISSNKKKLGYSIQNVDAQDIVDSRETNLVSALSGKAAGVNVVSSSGSPGASANITIRGNKSITGSNKPLFVVDGVPVDNSSVGNGTAGVDASNRAIDINPNDIKSLTILKGPAATALYGIRAANGAVIITTKNGAQGKPKVSFTSSFSIDKVNQLPERQNEYAQGTITAGNFVYQGPDATAPTVNSWGPALVNLEFDGSTNYPWDRNGKLVPKGTGIGKAAIAYNPYDVFFVTGNTTDNNISVSGGSEKNTYYFSAGRLYQTGVVPNADFARNSFKVNSSFIVTPKLTIGSSASFVNSGGNRIQRGSNVSGVMAGLLRNTTTFDIANGFSGKDAVNNISTYTLPNSKQRAFTTAYDNPYWSAYNVPFKDNVNRFYGNLNLEYKLNSWMKLRYKLGIDNYSDERNSAWDIGSASNILGRVTTSNIISTDINSDMLLLINKSINKNIDADITFGHNYYSNKYVAKSIDGDNLSQKGFFDISNAAVISSNNNIRRRRLVGAFGDVKLTYKGFLFANFTGRNDWSSTLPKTNNSFFYPTFSTGLDLSKALNFESNPIVPYAKIRASLGQVGNDAPLYALDTYYDRTTAGGDELIPGINFPAFGVNAMERSGSLSNSNLKAERTTTFEVGGDFKFWDGKIGLDITYYDASTQDQIVTTTISSASGFLQQIINAGHIQNKGIEITLNTTPVKTKFFQWNLNVNFSKNNSIVKSLPLGVTQVSLQSFSALASLVRVGQPYGVLNGTNYQRNADGKLIIGADGWPLISTIQAPIGDPNPDFLAGVDNSFTFKNFELGMLWDFRKGGDIWNATKAFNSSLGISKESGDLRKVTGYVYDGVTVSGAKNTVPVDFANPANGLGGIKWRKGGTFGVSEDYIEDGSWARLRQVTLRYKLPKTLFKGLLSGSSISVYARNLLLFTKYSGIDPETNLSGDSNASGWDYYNLPNTKSYGINFQVSF